MRHHSPVFVALILIGSSAGILEAQRPPQLTGQQAGREAVTRDRARRDLLFDLQSGLITLPEAARRTEGRLVLDRPSVLSCFPNIRDLTDASSLVVVGRPFAARVELTEDRCSIVTTYSVQVDDTLKTPRISPFMQHVMVRMPGGRLDFDDGTSAEIRSALALGDRYVLFLEDERDARSDLLAAAPGTSAARAASAPDGAGVIYTPLQSTHGVFHLRADGTARLHEAATLNTLHRDEGSPEAVLLAAVKAAVAARRFCGICFSSNPPVRF
jgi:hypothetical protein